MKEDGSCTLPVAALSKLKMQHATKAVCVPRDTPGKPGDGTMACVEALVAAGITKPMAPTYMSEWPDELSGSALDAVSPYERRARALLFRGCYEMGALREGRFECAEATADHVIRVTKTAETRASIRYARTITLGPKLGAIEAACGGVSRPGPEASVTIDRVDKKWTVWIKEEAP